MIVVKLRKERTAVIRAVAAVLSLACATPSFAQVAELKRMSLEELSQLEVYSVSRNPEPYGRAPAAIQVITQDDIRRSGATNLAEALRLADNLIVAKKSSSGWAITARGFNTDLSNKLLVMIDGRTVYTPLFSGVFWSRQDHLLEDIDRIEVISGPGGTLWGANAVNGVINIITRHAKDSQGVYVEGGGGSQLTGIGAARWGGQVAPDAFLRVYGKVVGHDSEWFPQALDASDSWRQGQGGFRLDAGSSSRDALTLQGDVYVGRQQVPTGGTSDTTGGNVLGRWSRTESDTAGFTVQVYYDRTHLVLPVPGLNAGDFALAPPGTLRDDLDTFDVDFQHRLAFGDGHRATWGLGYRFTHDVVQNSPALGFEPPLLNQSLYSGFVQDEIAVASNVNLTLGSKIEHNDYTGFEAEPSGRLQWTPSARHMVWAAVSRAVRAPSRVDRDERLGTPALEPFVSNLLIGGPDFASETVVAYEAGTRAQLGARLSASASAFYNRYDDLRSTTLGPLDPVLQLPFPLFFENNLEGETLGVEVSADQQVTDAWRLHAGYAFLGEDIRVKAGKSDFNNALNETADPRHRLTLRSSASPRPDIDLDVALRWIDSFVFNTSGVPATVPSYAEMNVRLAWRPTERLELSLVAQDLVHGHHLEYVVSSPNPREEVARNVYGKAAFRW